MSNDKFRKKALDQLSSPEQLDQLMEVSSPAGWSALLGLGLILAGGLAWGIWGTIPTKVFGMGILLQPGGLANVVSVAEGQVKSLDVAVGDQVDEGMQVATLFLPELREEIDQARSRIGELQHRHRELEQLDTENTRLRTDSLIRERRAQRETIEHGNKAVKWLGEKLARKEALYKQQLILIDEIDEVRQEIYDQEERISQAQSRLEEIEADIQERKKSERLSLFESALELDEARYRLQLLEKRLEVTSKIVSPFAGRVVEIKVREGVVLDKGTAVISVERERARAGLQAIIYMRSADGKRVQPDMIMRVVPSTVKKEEYGSIIARVKDVSRFPATPEGMLRVLGNRRLVDQFMQDGAPITVTAELEQDAATHSGFSWTSSGGPPLEIVSGTITRAEVVIEKKKPISLIIPFLKKQLEL